MPRECADKGGFGCHPRLMSQVREDAVAPPAPDSPRANVVRRRRVWFAVAVAVAVVFAVVITLVVVTRPRAATPEEFAAFSQKLATLQAPVGAFAAFDPSTSSYRGSQPQGTWVPTGSGVWTDTQDSTWWVSVRGWQASVPVGQEHVACRAALDWTALANSTLSLVEPGQDGILAACLAAIVAVRTDSGVIDDVWTTRGIQTADGQMRYRTGGETFTGERPGEVVLRVTADATVANR